MGMGMARTKINRLLFSGLLATFCLTGCTKTNEITAGNATEVALDSLGVTEKQVKNLNCEDESKNFVVTFDMDSGSYRYEISKAGRIEGHTYTANNSIASESQEEENKESEQKPDEQSQPEETPEETQSLNAKPSETGHSSSVSAQNEVYLNAALANSGLEREDVTDISVQPEGNLMIVEYQVGVYKNRVSVDKETGTVVSTVVYQE